MSDPATLPVVTCKVCGRQVACMQVSDGTVYRPFAWHFEDGGLSGVCGLCHSFMTEVAAPAKPR